MTEQTLGAWVRGLGNADIMDGGKRLRSALPALADCVEALEKVNEAKQRWDEVDPQGVTVWGTRSDAARLVLESGEYAKQALARLEAQREPTSGRSEG